MRQEPITITEYVYTVVFEPDPEAGGYVATCSALPGLVTEGDSFEEARVMAADAIRVYLESLREDGLPLPESDIPANEALRVPIAANLTLTSTAHKRSSMPASSSTSQ